MKEVIVLLERLCKLSDSRSAEIIMNYFLGVGLWEEPMKDALIAIGPPSVPLLIPLLEPDTRLLGRLIGAKLLGIIGSEHRQELGGAVEHIILPKLEKLVTSDPSPRVRSYASVAISRIRYRQQDNTVEPPERNQHEITETIEQPQVSHVLEPVAEDEEDLTEQPAGLVAAAWARLEYISQNPQEWGNFSPEATKLMEQLTPTWVMRSEGEGEKAIELLDQLTKLHDPRSAEIFVNYLLNGISGKPMSEALIAIGPPSVPLLIPLLDTNADLGGRLTAPRLLGIIGSEYRQELGGAVEYIILPKLEKLATSDPIPEVRQIANEALSRLNYRKEDSTGNPQIEVQPKSIDQGSVTPVKTGEQFQGLHVPEPVAEDEKDLTEQPAGLVAAAWARLEYISQNPQEWGEFSPEATKLMEQLTPTWTMHTEGEGEEAMELLNQLTKWLASRPPFSKNICQLYAGGDWGKADGSSLDNDWSTVSATINLAFG